MLLYNRYCEESKNTEQDAEAEIRLKKIMQPEKANLKTTSQD